MWYFIIDSKNPKNCDKEKTVNKKEWKIDKKKESDNAPKKLKFLTITRHFLFLRSISVISLTLLTMSLSLLLVSFGASGKGAGLVGRVANGSVVI